MHKLWSRKPNEIASIRLHKTRDSYAIVFYVYRQFDSKALGNLIVCIDWCQGYVIADRIAVKLLGVIPALYNADIGLVCLEVCCSHFVLMCSLQVQSFVCLRHLGAEVFGDLAGGSGNTRLIIKESISVIGHRHRSARRR